MTSDPPFSLKTLPLRGDGTSIEPSSPQTPLTPTSMKGLTPLSSKVTSILSTSYGDAEFRDALALLDERGIQNTAESRRRLRLELQKEVIDSNGAIVAEFGRVAEVGFAVVSL
jgi:conserved oligomeric Golgi complex subunit 6